MFLTQNTTPITNYVTCICLLTYIPHDGNHVQQSGFSWVEPAEECQRSPQSVAGHLVAADVSKVFTVYRTLNVTIATLYCVVVETVCYISWVKIA